jgi:hypothetical protein
VMDVQDRQKAGGFQPTEARNSTFSMSTGRPRLASDFVFSVGILVPPFLWGAKRGVP